MGAGKSTLGPALARALRRPFVDADRRSSAAAGASVAELFAREGESGFRARERAALDALAGRSAVVALGGGAIAQPDAPAAPGGAGHGRLPARAPRDAAVAGRQRGRARCWPDSTPARAPRAARGAAGRAQARLRDGAHRARHRRCARAGAGRRCSPAASAPRRRRRRARRAAWRSSWASARTRWRSRAAASPRSARGVAGVLRARRRCW